MDSIKKRLASSGLLLLGLPFFGISSAFAAKPVDLSHQKLNTLQSFISAPAQGTEVVEISRSVSRANTLHVRVQQKYAGYKVWGADAVVHVPNAGKSLKGHTLQNLVGVANGQSTMNGTLYQNLNKDLANTRKESLSGSQSNKVVDTAVNAYTKQLGASVNISGKKAERIIFVTEDNRAHWAYHVSFNADAVSAGELPAKPNYIMDAETMKVYAEWNDIKTAGQNGLDEVSGGGFGGNKKMGKLSYDGTTGDLHYASLVLTREAGSKTCYLQNSDVIVRHARGSKVMSFSCPTPDHEHVNLYWSGEHDAVNDAYSPGNDALFGGAVIKNMYNDWYHVPVLTENGQPMKLTMVVHAQMENAYWDGSKMTFGDGGTRFYPLTSLGVAAHEISHGFTEQHSNLAYYSQSGGMNEAFSDMAAQGAEFYAYGKNSWQIGPEIYKAANQALRYMDKPSKDCGKRDPGNWCSIDDADQYFSGLDVHYSSGVFNRAYYLMGTAEGWNAHKAFDVMVNANQNYWTSTSSFNQGACGVISSAKELGYDVDVVKAAFDTVKVDYSEC